MTNEEKIAALVVKVVKAEAFLQKLQDDFLVMHDTALVQAENAGKIGTAKTEHTEEFYLGSAQAFKTTHNNTMCALKVLSKDKS